MDNEVNSVEDATRQLLSAALEVSGAFTWEFSGDRFEVSDNFQRVLGTSTKDFPAFHAALVEAITAESATGNATEPDGRELRSTYQVLLPGGRVRWMQVAGRVTSGTISAPVHTIGAAIDVTEHHLAEETSHDIEELLGTSVDPTRYAYLGVDDSGRVRDWSPDAEVLFGWRDDEILGRDAGAVLASSSTRDPQRAWWRMLSTGAAPRSLQFVRKDGTQFSGEATTLRATRGDPMRVRVLIRDLTPRLRLETHLRYRSLFDPVTLLAGRALLVYRLRQAIARLRRRRSSVAILSIDLDHFIAINDALGQESGDAILEIIGERLVAECRPTDTIARSGGDEFVIVAEDVGQQSDAVKLARRIGRAISVPIHVPETEFVVTASVGVTLTSTPDAEPEVLLREADAAMHRAKTAGRARCELFGAEYRDQALARIALEQEIRGAAEREELELHYQAIVDIASGTPAGAEALVRWRHPVRGLLAPDEFIPIAEDTEEIVRIGAWVLRTACTAAADWPVVPGRRSLGLNVNLSALELADPQLIQRVGRALRTSNLDPARLTLEITERMVMADPERAARTVRRLRALGVRVAFDDFGTGYSSLGYLRHFEVDDLKIDRTFVSGLLERPADAKIIQLVIRLAKELNMTPVAEGVELQEQRDQLEWLGCSLGQGYLWSPPLSSAAFQRWLGESGGTSA